MKEIDKTIQEYAGTDKAKAAEFKRVLTELHRMKESAAVENNVAMRDVFQFFGLGGGKFASIVRQLRDGKDGDGMPKLDEMVEYACRNYRHLMPCCGGESDSGSDEQAFTEWVAVGFLEVPTVDDEDVLNDVVAFLGPAFFEDEPIAKPQKSEAKARGVNLTAWRKYVEQASAATGPDRERMLKQIMRSLKRLPSSLQQVIKSEIELDILVAG